MSIEHWKNYEPIERVAVFDANGAGPIVGALQVIANTHSSDAYPEVRIGIVVAGLGSAMLTSEQSAQLRAYLDRAERDVRVGGPPVTRATRPGIRCESCSQPIRIGELVQVYEEEDVVVHYGPCPSEERHDGG